MTLFCANFDLNSPVIRWMSVELGMVALNNDLNILTAIAVRTCFDVVSEVCKVDESLPFAEKINELVKQGRIGIAQKARLGALIDAGGASAHRGWVPDLAEINLLGWGLNCTNT